MQQGAPKELPGQRTKRLLAKVVVVHSSFTCQGCHAPCAIAACRCRGPLLGLYGFDLRVACPEESRKWTWLHLYYFRDWGGWRTRGWTRTKCKGGWLVYTVRNSFIDDDDAERLSPAIFMGFVPSLSFFSELTRRTPCLPDWERDAHLSLGKTR